MQFHLNQIHIQIICSRIYGKRVLSAFLHAPCAFHIVKPVQKIEFSLCKTSVDRYLLVNP